jgi:hypothetical protein
MWAEKPRESTGARVPDQEPRRAEKVIDREHGILPGSGGRLEDDVVRVDDPCLGERLARVL